MLEKYAVVQSPSQIEALVRVFVHATRVSWIDSFVFFSFFLSFFIGMGPSD